MHSSTQNSDYWVDICQDKTIVKKYQRSSLSHWLKTIELEHDVLEAFEAASKIHIAHREISTTRGVSEYLHRVTSTLAYVSMYWSVYYWLYHWVEIFEKHTADDVRNSHERRTICTLWKMLIKCEWLFSLKQPSLIFPASLPVPLITTITRKRAIGKALQLKGHSDFAPVDLAYYQHSLGFFSKIMRFGKFRVAATNAGHVTRRPLSTIN